MTERRRHVAHALVKSPSQAWQHTASFQTLPLEAGSGISPLWLHVKEPEKVRDGFEEGSEKTGGSKGCREKGYEMSHKEAEVNPGHMIAEAKLNSALSRLCRGGEPDQASSGNGL